MCRNLVLHVKSAYAEDIQDWEEWEAQDWEGVKERMLDEYIDDRERNKFTLKDAKSLVSRSRRKGWSKSIRGLTKFYQKLTRATKYLRNRELIGWQQESQLFIEGLTPSLTREWRKDRRQNAKSRRLVEQVTKEGSRTTTNTDIGRGAPRTKEEELADDAQKRKESRAERRNRPTFQQMEKVEDIYDQCRMILEYDDLESWTTGASSAEESSSDEDSDKSSDSDDSDHDSGYNSLHKRGRKKDRHDKKRRTDSTDDEEKKDSKKGSTKSSNKSSPASSNQTNSTRDGSSVVGSDLMNSLNERFEKMHLFNTNLEKKLETVLNTRLNARQPTPPYSQRPPYVPRVPSYQPAPAVHVAAAAGYGGTGSNAYPITPGRLICFTCGGPHSFKNYAECEPARRFLDSGVWVLNELGNPLYRGFERLPLSHTLPEGTTFEDWTNMREAERRKPGGSASGSTRFRTPPAPPSSPKGASIGLYYQDVSDGHEGYSGAYSASDQTTYEDEGEVFHAFATKRKRTASDEGDGRTRTQAPSTSRRRGVQIREEDEETELDEPPTASTSRKAAKGKSRATYQEDEEMTDATEKTRRKPISHLRNSFQEETSRQEVLDALLEAKVEIPVKMLLASSSELTRAIGKKCARKRVALPGAGSSPEGSPSFHANGANLSALGKSILAGRLGRLAVYINGHRVEALIDSGSQINLISENFQRTIGLPMTLETQHTLGSIHGDIKRLSGVCRGVTIRVGGIDTKGHTLLVAPPSTAHQLVLGVPFCRMVQATTMFKPNGRVMLEMTIGDQKLLSTITVEDTRFKEDAGKSGQDNWESSDDEEEND